MYLQGRGHIVDECQFHDYCIIDFMIYEQGIKKSVLQKYDGIKGKLTFIDSCSACTDIFRFNIIPADSLSTFRTRALAGIL